MSPELFPDPVEYTGIHSRNYEHEDAVIVQYYRDNELVSCAGGYPKDSYYLLHFNATVPAYRRRGHGGFLFKKRLELIKGLGYKKARLFAFHDITPDRKIWFDNGGIITSSNEETRCVEFDLGG